MPTDIMNAVRMPPMAQLPHHSPVVPIRLLTKGPDYLRRQMETGTPRPTLSAVERLAADKAKYVKSPQVVSGGSSNGSQHNTRGSSASESSSGGSSQGGSSKKSHQEDLDHQTPLKTLTSNQENAPVRRSSGKRQLRPDSLVIYRQKSRGDGLVEQTRASLVKRLFQGTIKEKTTLVPLTLEENKVDNEEKPNGKESQDLRLRSGLHRSQSDISSRYSRSFSEFETFFKYCGLDPEVVEELGKDRFAAAHEELQDPLGLQHRIRSVSVATSESGFSRRSGDGSTGGLQEDEPLSGQLPSGNNNNTSVIERNARIIKWLYSCKKAKETRGGSPDLP
uniref:Family with sequence similarity 110 member C n=1 Tax=Leptobrachium leishanense TaxID=445787 RepID=A0A8C5MWV7_9ANUR